MVAEDLTHRKTKELCLLTIYVLAKQNWSKYYKLNANLKITGLK